MDEIQKEWGTAVGRMHRVVEGGRTLPWKSRRVLGGSVVCLGPHEMLCPLETKRELVGLLAKVPRLTSLVDAAYCRRSREDDDLAALRDECRKAVADLTAPPVGPWSLEAGKRSGVRSAILVSPSSEIGFVPIERKYLRGEVEEMAADLAVAASAPELMAACICLAEDPTDVGPCRFAMEAVAANLRKARSLMPSRRRRNRSSGVDL